MPMPMPGMGMPPPPMPGMGMPPPGAQAAMAGAPPGMADVLQKVQGLQKQPFSGRADKALRDGKLALGIALQDVALRSPGASKYISQALDNVAKAEAELKKLAEAQQIMAQPPPNLSGMSQPGMPGMGGMGTAPMGMPTQF